MIKRYPVEFEEISLGRYSLPFFGGGEDRIISKWRRVVRIWNNYETILSMDWWDTNHPEININQGELNLNKIQPTVSFF